MKRSLFLIGSIVFTNLLISQTGPGGVGSSASNSLWLQADDISQGDGTSISSWTDRSGNGNDASQGTGANQPTYETSEVNGHAVVRFDGTDDYFDDARSYNARTVFTVYNILSANQATTDLGQIWGNYAEGVHVSLDARGAGGTWSFDANNSVGNTGKLALNGAAYGAFGGNPSTPTWTYDQFDLVATEFNATRSVTRQVLGSLFPSFAVGTHQYGGDVAELIVYNTTLNDGQRIIVENYLAARYGLTIANDHYAFEGTHAEEVAGIGQESAGNNHTSAMSAGLLRIENATSMNDGDYLIFGHDNADATAWTTTETPDGGTNMQRFAREWILDETGDIGSVDFVIDAATFPAQPAGHTMYVVMIDADGDFSSGASVYELVNTSGTEYGVSGIDINDGEFVTIGVIRPIVEHSTSASSGNETINASISVELNYIPQADVTVDFTTADGTATTAQPDYTGVAPGTLTILASTSSANYAVTITNDIVIESDETLTITLSNPSVGIIGTNSVHTYTIQDDDNPRKIYFDAASSNGDESLTAGTIPVSINLVDAINPTTVDYTITGGTATGSGTDYTLASGTLTIPIGSTTASIPFSVNNDGLFEADETFIVTISNPSNCNLDAVAPLGGTGFLDHTYTINDNDTPPTVQFNSTSANGIENVTPAVFQVDLSVIAGTDVTVDYAITGTATGAGSDYTLSNGTLTIPAGSTDRDITAVIIDDSNEELPETIIVTLSNPNNATLGANTVFTYTIVDNDNTGKDGPGGVGESSNLQLWLRADDIAQADATAVSSWLDHSGNNHDATQGSGANQPLYRTGIVNGHSTVRFDGTDDFFSNAYNYSGQTVFLVYQMLAANQDVADLAQAWGSYSDGVQVGIDARSGGGNWSFDGGGTATAKFGIDGAAYGGYFANTTTPKWTYDTPEMLAVEFDASYAVTSQDIGSLISPTGHLLGGDIAELVVYDFSIDDAQRNIIENYLSSKYNIAITTDLYAHDGTFGTDVSGIGREDANNFHLDAQGDGMVRINTPSGMDDGEYLLWGHNNVNTETGSYAAPWTGGLPSGVNNAIHRVWRVDETGDMGTVTVMFDVSSLTVTATGDLVLLIDSDDGDFINATSIAISSYSAPYATFTGIDFSDGDWFTLGTTNPGNELPIELISFKAQVNNAVVDLNWSTASEINNDYFMLERSNTGKNWESIAKVNGAGNSTSILNYSYSDLEPLSGTSFYRLKQVDFNGEYSLSDVETVYFENLENTGVQIYPNPSTGVVTIIGKEFELNQVKIYNTLGQEVTEQTKLLTISKEQIQMDLTGLENGYYFIKTSSSLTKVSKQ
ncbi:MAG: T9SS type A sorting domain-containing protein [Flavobacteriales bacterium]|nr:T9SS type A sorting domain-containing protein [Flavobacteriales bacterium]MCB9198318.1 T9SS type A sorting domain-containing protein [Flavobacteriales bacterium]